MRLIDKKSKVIERHTIAVIVDDEAGVLARVIGLFASRGYNIDSLTVSVVDEKRGLSRITLVTKGTPVIVEHIIALLDRVVPVHDVRDLTIEGAHIEREVALLKVTNKGKERVKAMEIADHFGARVVDSTDHSFIFELSDTSQNLDTFTNQLKDVGLVEICRTGVAAMSRGHKGIEID
jgi:acetolactate synthase-1/3 small subunit